MHRNFPWPVVLKIFGIVSTTDSVGNQTTNFPTVLQRIHIHAFISMFEQWVEEMQNLSARSSFKSPRRSLLNTSKNLSLDCNFLFFFAPVNFRLRLIFVLVILSVTRQYTISLVQGSINSNKLLNNFIVSNLVKKFILWLLLISLHVNGVFHVLSFLFCATRYLFFSIFVLICSYKRNRHTFHDLATKSTDVLMEIEDVALGFRVVGF